MQGIKEFGGSVGLGFGVWRIMAVEGFRVGELRGFRGLGWEFGVQRFSTLGVSKLSVID